MKTYVYFVGRRHEIMDVDIDTLSRIVLINEVMSVVFKRNCYYGEQFKLRVLMPDKAEKQEIKTDFELMKCWQLHLDLHSKEIEFQLEFIPIATDNHTAVPDATAIEIQSPYATQQSAQAEPSAGTQHSTEAEPSVGKENLVEAEPSATEDSETPNPAEDIDSADSSELEVEHTSRSNKIGDDFDDYHMLTDAEDEKNEDEAEANIEDEDIGGDSLLDGFICTNDDMGPGSQSEDEHPFSRMSRELHGQRYQKMNYGKLDLEIGMVFDNLESFGCALVDYAVQEGFRLKRVKWEKKKVSCQCYADKCPFRIYASQRRFSQCYQIKSLQKEHTCTGVVENPEASASWIARKCRTVLVSETPIEAIHKLIRRDYGVVVSDHKIYRARRKVMEEEGGDHAGSYKLLWDYAEIIRQKMPGALARMQVCNPNDGKCTFVRFILSFPALKDGFKAGCRPFIGLDGCHLKGPYKGVLLSAVSIDGNQGVFPIAFAVVDIENTDNWTWFLGLLRDYLDDRRAITFMTDRQKGILNALSVEWPGSKVRYCARHIFANLKVNFPELTIKDHFWAASRASSKERFLIEMNKIKELNIKAYDWLSAIEPGCWSVHAFEEYVKCDHVTNNMTESWNAWLGDQRKQPIVTLFEYIRKKLMKAIVDRRLKSESWKTDLPPHIHKRLMATVGLVRQCAVIPANTTMFEVDDPYNGVSVVKLGEHECDCGLWQRSGLPCRHAMACIAHLRHEYAQYIDPYFSKQAYQRCYSGVIQPLPDQAKWPHQDLHEVQPPPVHRLPGRPKISRRRELNETPAHRRRYVGGCTTCKQLGHNKRACPFDPANNKKKTKTIEKHRKIADSARSLSPATGSTFSGRAGSIGASRERVGSIGRCSGGKSGSTIGFGYGERAGNSEILKPITTKEKLKPIRRSN